MPRVADPSPASPRQHVRCGWIRLCDVGLYNNLRAVVTCPRCGQTEEVEAQIYVGHLDLYEYRLGDQLRYDNAPMGFARRDEVDGEGYAECPKCGKDFWLDVAVREGHIVSASAADRPGYIP